MWTAGLLASCEHRSINLHSVHGLLSFCSKCVVQCRASTCDSVPDCTLCFMEDASDCSVGVAFDEMESKHQALSARKFGVCPLYGVSFLDWKLLIDLLGVHQLQGNVDGAHLLLCAGV